MSRDAARADKIKREGERVRRIPIVEQILAELRAKLSPNLVYHCAQHTENVLDEAISFAVTDGLEEREIELLAIASAFHDAGFLVRMNDNEGIAADMARAAMERSKEFTPDEIRVVEKMILDTQLNDYGAGYENRPSSKLSKYLLDADLSNLGREDFFENLEKLQQELGGDFKTRLQGAHQLLVNHHWLSPAAQAARDDCKRRNLAEIKRRLDGAA